MMMAIASAQAPLRQDGFRNFTTCLPQPPRPCREPAGCIADPGLGLPVKCVPAVRASLRYCRAKPHVEGPETGRPALVLQTAKSH